MKKTAWTVLLPDRPSFQMVVLEGKVSQAQALEIARSIWPSCTVE